ncbi:extensin [Gossypium raimondii]|uniref:extensin n=1 Tax=Gossypium raimondii TaxID=29730 RepID=UPI00227BCB50|nr:extensin [Gossypium raimondii]
MDGRRWGGDGGRGRPKRSRVSATDGGNEPREGSTSPTATQNPSAVIGQEQEAEPRRFTSHNYTRSPSRSPPQSRPPIRRTPSYPPPRTFPPSCQPPRPPPQSRPPIRHTPSYPPPRTFPPSSQPPRPPPQSRPPIRRTPSYPPPRTFPPSCQPPRPPTPTAPILPPRPLKSFPQRAEQPLRQPSLALSPRHSSPVAFFIAFLKIDRKGTSRRQPQRERDQRKARMAMMRKEILVDQQAASSSGTNNRQVVTDLERLNKAILMILTQTIVCLA